MERSHDYLPFPEIVDPRRGIYRILDASAFDVPGSVDLVQRRLCVPLRGDGRHVMRHELAHVHWSPLRLPDVEFPRIALQAVEDGRINLGLAFIGLPVELDAEQRANIRLLALRDLKQRRASDFALRWAASLGTNVAGDLAAVARGAGDAGTSAARLVAAVQRQLRAGMRGRTVAPFACAVEAARELARALAACERLDPAFAESKLELACCTLSEVEVARERRRGRPGGAPDACDGGARSGVLSVVEAPLGERHRDAARGLKRGWRPACEGSQLGALHRYALDRAIFRRARRRAGGSVLIDASGSMGIGAADIDALLDASRGAALVAMYSGRRDRGELRVVARGGRRAAAAELVPAYGGNVVDVPSLEWLARQAPPRFWVSDGGASGLNDEPSQAIRERCAAICRAASIRRYASAAEAAEGLAAGGRGARRAGAAAERERVA